MEIRVDGANNWPGFSELVCEVEGDKDGCDAAVFEVVVKSLKEHYAEIGLELPNAGRLAEVGVRTATVGHQLQLFGGPAFLHYKVITAIRKAEEVGAVPVFWIASEDHDFEEIRWVWGESEKYVWDGRFAGGEVGQMSLEGLEDVFTMWRRDVNSDDLDEIGELLKESDGLTYAQFYTKLLHMWYGDKGLVVLDASRSELKRLFAGSFAKELKGEGVANFVDQKPVKPRGVNLFYSPEGGQRVGIVRDGDKLLCNGAVLNEGGLSWEDWAEENAGSLSPSVLFRPLYQEFLLPNSHVILGPSELKYWVQARSAFEGFGIGFPNLHLRDHIVVVEEGTGWSIEDGWRSSEELVAEFVDGELKDRFGALLVDLSDEDLVGVVKGLGLDIGIEELVETNSPRVRQRLRKTAIKKIRRRIREEESGSIEGRVIANDKIVKGNIPQDRWSNFHVLSMSLGGFVNFRDKLLETKGAESPVMQVIVASKD